MDFALPPNLDNLNKEFNLLDSRIKNILNEKFLNIKDEILLGEVNIDLNNCEYYKNMSTINIETHNNEETEKYVINGSPINYRVVDIVKNEFKLKVTNDKKKKIVC
jgi:hypothetical protein